MKKNIISVFIIVTLLTVQCLFTVSANAEIVDSGTCGQSVTWTLDSNGTLTISGSGFMDGYIPYPESLPWSSHISDIKSVVINDGVTSIGTSAFYGCSSLISVTIPDGVTSIGSYAFSGCSSLTNVTIPVGVTIIYNNTFSCCSSLTSVTIPDGVTDIGRYAFSACKSLTSLSIPTSVTYIGEHVFDGCFSLTGIYITDMAAWCRIQCDGSNPLSYAKNLYLNNELVTDLVIPDGVTSICNYAFYGCSCLTVTIPDGVTSIGNFAFADCRNLKNVTIPTGVTSIGSYAFRGCSNLIDVTIPDGVKNIRGSAFRSCSNLTNVTIPDSVTSIGGVTFMGCSSLTEINVDENNENYASIDGVLMNKDKTEIIQCPGGKTGVYVIPDGVTSIDDVIFIGCSSLTGITIPAGVIYIDNEAFSDCAGLIEINVDKNNENFASSDGVLMNKDKTEIIRYPIGKTGSYAIPAGVKSIGDAAFSGCSSLTGITIPAGMTNIGSSAFFDCSSLTNVTIPDTVTSISYSAFSACAGLTEINVDENNKNYTSSDGVLMNKSKTEIIQCPGGKTGVYVIPDGVTSIGSDTFSGCSNLTNVTIPNVVTTIGAFAFSNCSSLTYIIIPNSVTDIKRGAFSGCSSLKSVKIPDGITTIESSVFSRCTGLTSIIIPDGVTSIEWDAFFDCSSLTNVTIPDSVIYIDYSVFPYCDKLTDVYYAGSVGKWLEIEIEMDNAPLEFAVIHYNSTAPAPTAPAVVEITASESDSEYVFTVTPVIVNENCQVYGTAYGADGRLLSCSAKELETADETTVGVKKSDDITLVKAFVWTDNMQPVEVMEIKVK